MRGPYLALIKLKKGDFKYYIILGYYHNKIYGAVFVINIWGAIGLSKFFLNHF